MEEEVVKKGLLYLQQQQTFGKKWRKFWGVLYKECACSPARLELLEGSGPPSMEKSKKGEGGRRLIKLSDCVHVAKASEDASSPKETTPFLLETTEKGFLLAAERAEAADWILELCEHAFSRSREGGKALLERGLFQGPSASLTIAENSLYSSRCKEASLFPVTVRATPASERCQLWGWFLLSATPDALELCDTQEGTALYSWPYKFLRRFGHDKLLFSFEAGRRCSSGEGCFEFATKRGGEIIQVIEAAIQVHKDAEASGPPAPSLGVALRGGAGSQAKAGEEGSQPGDKAQAPDRGLPSHPASAKALSLESSWPGKPAKGKPAKPSSSCPLSGPTRAPYKEPPCAPRRPDSQDGAGVLEWAGKRTLPPVRVVPESEYGEPLDTLARGRAGSDGRAGTEEAPSPCGAYDRIDDLGPGPAQSQKPEHIYDEPDVLAHMVYDEPQEVKGDAWKLQARAEDPVGHQYPYNPWLDDYAVPKMAQLPRKDLIGLGETGCGRMVLSLKKRMNQQ
ncbi:docking protein 2 [Hemicordylus capensis]|uniref:docking protein 2 n=1 Tax=Hemicordylus capensis TaxID=884348 RepID=UPI002302FF63|nr:docking protein 2 [Hemicordylus capensis]